MLQSSAITEMQFAELIQDCELKLIESNGVYRLVDSDKSNKNSMVQQFDGEVADLN